MLPLEVFEHNYDNQRQIPEQTSLNVSTTDKTKAIPVPQPPTGSSALGASPAAPTNAMSAGTQTLTEKGSDILFADGELAVQWLAFLGIKRTFIFPWFIFVFCSFVSFRLALCIRTKFWLYCFESVLAAHNLGVFRMCHRKSELLADDRSIVFGTDRCQGKV